MRIRGRAYIWLKIAKAQLPFIKRVRLLKKEARVESNEGRPILDAAAGNAFLRDRVAAARPTAAVKIGDTELEVLVKYKRFESDPDQFFKSISEGHELELLYINTGVFPKRQDIVVRWADVYLEALAKTDLLAVWHNTGERELVAERAPQATLTGIEALEPYYHKAPWTQALEGRRVTVVTPFADSISHQHARYGGKDLFPDDPTVLPDFELRVVRSPFSAGLQPPVHPDWHTALEDLQEQIAATELDVCLVGAGAWSVPLCAFVRENLQRPAVHLGGALQILFGIRGKRWEQGHEFFDRLFTDKWIRPLTHERPRRNWKQDGGAYW